MTAGAKIWVGAAVIAALVIVGFGFVRYAFALPKPSGPYPVGTVAIRVDRPLEHDETDPGSFPVQIWYPSEPSGARARYGTGVGGLKHRVYDLLVRTNAAPGAPFTDARRRFPILVYSSAWGGERTDNTSLLEDLASRGYVVAAFGDVHYDDPPLERLEGAADFGSAVAYHQTLHLASAKIAYLARRASVVLDRLAVLDARDPDGRFTGHLDLTRAGALGYSLGGAVAFKAATIDRRFKAAMNMDGWLFDASSDYDGGIPYFMISDREAKPGPAFVADPDPQTRYTSQLTVQDLKAESAVLRHGGYELVVNDANHLSFSDIPLFALKHRFARGKDDPRQMARAIHAYAEAFFDEALNGKPSPLLVAGEKRTPAMTLASWPVRR